MTIQLASRVDIINKIVEYLQKRLPAKQAKMAETFIKQFYTTVALDDLQEHDLTDLCGSALSFWNFIYQRKPNETKSRIYNPYYEQHGWQSTHTIVEVSQDDMPFIVDSIRMELNRTHLNIHFSIHAGGLRFRRDEEGRIIEVLPRGEDLTPGVTAEAAIYMECDRQTDQQMLEQIKGSIEKVLADVRAAVTDWQPMLGKLRENIKILQQAKPPIAKDELDERIDFLNWLKDGNFIFLGYREYTIEGEGEERALVLRPNSGLGVLADESHCVVRRPFSTLPEEALNRFLNPAESFTIVKTNTIATVHRPAYSDYFGIKCYDDQGNIVGESRFIGLYTSSAYNSSPKQIPMLRLKVDKVMQASGLPRSGHSAKALLNILETLPRDDLFQAEIEELLELGLGIVNLQERQRIRLFARQDIYGRFISCLVFVPRERFHTELRQLMQDELVAAFAATSISFSTQFSESMLARIHFVVRIDPKKPKEYNLREIETKLIDIARTWNDELFDELLEYYGEERGNALALKYANAFSAGYREQFESRTAVFDIEHMEKLANETPLVMNMYQPFDEQPGVIRFKLYHREHGIPLSDVLPILENLGLRVLGERPYRLKFKEGEQIWINDFGMIHSKGDALQVAEVKDIFENAFGRIWYKQAEDDGFNKLVLGANLNWRQVTVLRAYAKYLKQTGFTFSQSYIEETLVCYPQIARLLIELFEVRFVPEEVANRSRLIKRYELILEKECDNVLNLDQDRILRRFIEVIQATLRTNNYQADKTGQPKNYISFKLDPSAISDLPLPRPMFEIFVYSPRFEGVHLRGARVARGGLRWSDRREDFRTEILGLMKAQQVKNAVIVPAGAKGGFVPKLLPKEGGREALMAEVISCYQTFIAGLLDITDNLSGGKVVYPPNVYRFDEEADPYLVVAADKGTASFSDIANKIAKEYGFWLGDAFASGGSAGYDHKKMSITARGAWESVKRHFRNLGVDTQTTDFTVVGIGDMSGDVFGNGMLLSEHIKLVAAFNHEHIFLDPNPNPGLSYAERQRLFQLPRSTWEDYDVKLLSKGGGIYKRTEKSIKLSAEVKQLLDVKKDSMAPNELIRAILLAPVDLLWNGGIGTYMKAHHESNTDVGDRANDAVRVNGEELRCKVVGEGGNLGCTQSGRMEYSLQGGHIYTDFIDNSAGVDCSDHEVNIKILLNGVVANGDLTEKQRNQLLAGMTDEVAELVLADNYNQTQAIDLEFYQAHQHVNLHTRYIEELERKGLNRSLEFLPDKKTLLDRKVQGKGLTRPAIAILLAYTKNNLKQDILSSDVPEDPYFSRVLESGFPKPLRTQYAQQIKQHSLRREIIATLLGSSLVNEMGVTFVARLHDETGAPVSAIVRAYTIARSVFNIQPVWEAIESLDGKVKVEVQMDMMLRISRLIRHATRWFLRNRRTRLDITSTCQHFASGIGLLLEYVLELHSNSDMEYFQVNAEQLIQQGVPEQIAWQITKLDSLYSALEIIEGAIGYNFDLLDVAKTYHKLGHELDLSWFRNQIVTYPADTYWDTLAREALRDDLDLQQCHLAIGLLKIAEPIGVNGDEKAAVRYEQWLERHGILIQRWQAVLADLRSQESLDYVMFFVALRELLDLAQTTLQQPA
jgi:glutamate dehydrogenase